MLQKNQPHADWPWTLSESGVIRQNFTWEDIEYDLKELYPDNDSFLILEQKDPGDRKNYWFIQCAIALKGPKKDHYIVGVGWNGESGPVLMERTYHWDALEEEVMDIFEWAYQRRPLDLSGFENFEL
ncbi:MAG: hypothetical protein K2K53_06295 [Oscillospiraceae bacterium]|nr:hypothetical protein [Oscillospiraceae bacterium]